jgi:hypothetical protein
MEKRKMFHTPPHSLDLIPAHVSFWLTTWKLAGLTSSKKWAEVTRTLIKDDFAQLFQRWLERRKNSQCFYAFTIFMLFAYCTLFLNLPKKYI